MTGAENQAKQSRFDAAQERYRIRFDESVGFQSKSVRHDKAAVLLLSWDESQDDLKVKDEVNELEGVFRTQYGFKVYNRRFSGNGKRTELQARKYLTDFAHDEDGERVLLIVYYAGHGYSDESVKGDDIKLAGEARPPKRITREDQLNRTHFVWSKAEGSIMGLEADVLLIFDCCHAGRLCHARGGFDAGFFEFLGSCLDDQKARTPGPTSFTKALIWALRQLAHEEESFDTNRLRQTIIKAPNFSKLLDDQTPVLSDRHQPSGHVVIDRKGLSTAITAVTRRAPSRHEKEQALKHQQTIDIRLHFDQQINDTVIDNTIEELTVLRKHATLNISRIEYVCMKPKLAKYVNMIMRERATSLVTPGGVPHLKVQIPNEAGADMPQMLSAHSPLQVLIPAVTLPLTPAASDRLSRASSVHPDDERAPLLLRKRTESRRRYGSDDSITYHLQALARRLRTVLSDALAWMSCKLLPHTQVEDRDLEAQ